MFIEFCIHLWTHVKICFSHIYSWGMKRIQGWKEFWEGLYFPLLLLLLSLTLGDLASQAKASTVLLFRSLFSSEPYFSLLLKSTRMQYNKKQVNYINMLKI